MSGSPFPGAEAWNARGPIAVMHVAKRPLLNYHRQGKEEGCKELELKDN